MQETAIITSLLQDNHIHYNNTLYKQHIVSKVKQNKKGTRQKY